MVNFRPATLLYRPPEGLEPRSRVVRQLCPPTLGHRHEQLLYRILGAPCVSVRGTGQRTFDHLQKNLDRYLKIVDQRPDRFVFGDYSKKYGVVTVTRVRPAAKVTLAQMRAA